MFFERSEDMCAFQEPLGDIGRTGMYALFLLLLLFRIHLRLLLLLLLSFVIIII